MNNAAVGRWWRHACGAAVLALLAGCASSPHKMGDPLAGLEVKPASGRPANLRHLAHEDVAVVLSRNTQSVIDAVSVSNGRNIMFNEGALPKSPDYDFAAQIASASTELFLDRFPKVVKASSLENASRDGMRTAAILDLQVFDSKPGARGYFFHANATVYFVDVASKKQLGELSAGETLKLTARELGGDARTRKNKLLNQVLAQTFWSLSREMDARLGPMRPPVVLPVAASAAQAGAAPAAKRAHHHVHHRSARLNHHLIRLARKLRTLDEMHAYGLLSDEQYDARKHKLLHQYRRYLD
jgi:hypothetical protein